MRASGSTSQRRSWRALAGGVAAAAAAATLFADQASAASPHPAPVFGPETTLDLARMTIRATDLPGQGYGTHDGSVLYSSPGSTTEYSYSIGLPNPATNGDTLLRRINSSVELFTDATQAQADLDGFRAAVAGQGEGPQIVVEGREAAPRQVVPNAPIIGDDSITTTLSGSTVGGTAVAHVVEISMRVDRIVASLAISDFSGATPSLDELRQFAEEMVRRAREGLANNWTGMYHRMVRFDDTGEWTADGFETYTVIDGIVVPFEGDSAEIVADRTAFFAAARVDDAYTYQGSLERQTDGAWIAHTAWMYTFANEVDAAAYLEMAATDAMSSGAYASPVRATPTGAAGPAVAISMDIARNDAQPSAGHRVWVQVGSSVISVQIHRLGGLPLAAAIELANAQVACATSTAICQVVPAPGSLVG